jgi:parallel beta-helix repeat protein
VNLGSTPTLVLVAQPKPYTLSDVETLIPSALVRQPDGSYLLSDNVVIQAGATLSIANPDGLTLRLASSSKGFVSIIGLGGSLVIQGSAKKMVLVESWDPTTGSVDSNTTDGRGYLRVIGGTADVSYASFSHLGFWSGGTGGLALTGTQTAASVTAKSSSPTQPLGASSTSNSIHGATVQSLKPTNTIGGIASSVASAPAQYSYVTARVSHSRFTSDAFGIYVNGAQGVDISNTTVLGSLVDGIVFHRFVTNSTVTSTTTSNNAIDGFAMTRASTGVIVRGLTANHNGRDGISLDGGALASGPNAAGAAVAVYGDNSVLSSTSNSNGRYGITISGGQNVKVIGNTVDSDFMGIAVSRAAVKLLLSDNIIRNSSQHGIAFFSGTNASTVEDNNIVGADIGIYVRDASANVTRNTISGVHLHGITFIGANTGSKVTANTVSGSGPTAVDTARGSGVIIGGNTSAAWTATKPLLIVLGSIFRPLTVFWILLALVVLISAISGIGRKHSGFRHPYADQVPLSSLTKGIVAPQTLGLAGIAANQSKTFEQHDGDEQHEHLRALFGAHMASH